MKMRLPQAFVDCIEEIAIRQNGEAASKNIAIEFLAGLIAYLDKGEEKVLKRYTIPRFISMQYYEIKDTYLLK